MDKKKDNKQKEYIIEYDMNFMNIFAVVLLALMTLVTFLLVKIDVIKISGKQFLGILDEKYLIFFVVMLAWMVLHEIIHGVTYQLTGADKKDIVYGASLENSVFYCKCKEYINKKCIISSLLAPLVIIGIVTYILGIVISSAWLIVLSIVNISGAAADIMMFLFFMKQKDDVQFRELGFSSPAVVKTSEDISKNKYLGVKNIREVTDEAEVTEGPEKKITISKATWWFIAVIGIIFILDFVLIYLIK